MKDEGNCGKGSKSVIESAVKALEDELSVYVSSKNTLLQEMKTSVQPSNEGTTEEYYYSSSSDSD